VQRPAPAATPAAKPTLERAIKPAPKPAAKPVAKQKVKRVTRRAATVTARPACDYGTTSTAYVNSGTRYPVRCGPQAVHPSDLVRQGTTRRRGRNTAATDPFVGSTLTIAPPRPVQVPPGYETVWDDGRLNPKRGVGTLSGVAATNLIWTNTVPRRLIDLTTGRDVTTKYGYLEYPYVNYALQKRALMAVGTPIYTLAVAPPANAATAARRAKPAARARTRDDAPALPITETADARLVEVGLYADEADVTAVIARLRSIGLPPKIARTAKGTIIAAGPFDAGALDAALTLARNNGFPQAELR
jgi:hypothetical protein